MNKKRNDAIGVIITIIVLTLLVFLSNLKIEKISYVENAFSKIVMPLQSSFTYIKNKLQGNNGYFSSLEDTKKENNELKQKNNELEERLKKITITKGNKSIIFSLPITTSFKFETSSSSFESLKSCS